MSSINFNASAMVALNTLQGVNRDLSEVQNQISTGKKISTARDNASIWAVSTVMQSDVMSFKTITDSLNLGAATVGTARSAAEQVTSLLQEMKSLATAAQEENVDRTKIQRDVEATRAQIASIVESAQFNGLNLLKAGSDVNLLASLNRSEANVVTPERITIERVDLTETAGTLGAAIADNAGGAVEFVNASAGGAVSGAVSDTGVSIAAATPAEAVAGGVQLGVADIAGTEATGTFTYQVQVGTKSVTATVEHTNGTATTAQTVIDAIEAALVADGLPTGVTVRDNADGTLDLLNSSDADLSVTVTDGIADGAAGNVTVGVLDTTDGTVTAGGTDAADTAALAKAVPAFTTEGKVDLTFDPGDVAAGSLFELAIDGQFVTYRAIEGDTATSVAEKLRDRATAILPDDVELSVSGGTISFVNRSGDAVLATAKANTGSAGGALEDLANINVTTSDAARAALVDIEVMLDSVIDAAAAFGSAQRRIDIQNDFISSLVQSLEAGVSALTDANLEEASARLQSLQVQQQLNIQALTIANQSPQAILALFR